MNREVKSKWLAALRSGDYAQGRGGLRDADNRFCCLGVLCDLYAQETGEEWGTPTTTRSFCGFGGQDRFPPLAVAEWAGLTDRGGEVGLHGSSLAFRNDTGASFDEIADIIEREL